MAGKEFRETLIAVMNMKIADAEKNPVYRENSYTTEDYVEGLNEGYLIGLKEALRTLEASEFLAV